MKTDTMYLNIISEYYDLSNGSFDDILTESDKEKQSIVISGIASKLYNHIKNDVDKINFGSIPLSKGDITKIDGYNNLVDCLNTLNDLIKEYRQSTDLVDNIYTAIENLKSRVRVMEKAFTMNSEFLIIVYNTTVLSIVSSISLLISTCIEYIKDNKTNDIKTAFDKASYLKSKDHVLFNSLIEFNNMCKKGDIDKIYDLFIKHKVKKIEEACLDDNKNKIVSLNEDSALILAILGLAIIPIFLRLVKLVLRNTIYWFMAMREDISSYFMLQAEFLENNANNYIEKRSDDSKAKKIYENQMKWVDRFRKISNAFMIKDKKAQNETEDRTNEDDKPKNHDEKNDGIF